MVIYLISLVSTLSFAAVPKKVDLPPVRFTYEIRLQGKQICSGTQVVAQGRLLDICTRHYNASTVRFRANIKRLSDNQYLVSGAISEYEKDGMPTLLSSPRISALADEKAEMSISDQDDNESVSMSVLVSP